MLTKSGESRSGASRKSGSLKVKLQEGLGHTTVIIRNEFSSDYSLT